MEHSLPLSLSLLPVVGLTFLAAGLVKGLLGLGLPTVVMAFLGLVMPPAEAAALMVLPSLLANLWQGLRLAGLCRLAGRLWPFLVSLVGALLAVGHALPRTDPGLSQAILGGVLVAYAAWGLAGRSLRLGEKAEAWCGPLAGGLAGAMTAATGVAVMPTVVFLQALGLERDDLVQALGLTFTASTLALATVLVGGPLDGRVAAVGLAAFAPVVMGMAVARRLRQHLDPARFRRVFLAALGVIGLRLFAAGVSWAA